MGSLPLIRRRLFDLALLAIIAGVVFAVTQLAARTCPVAEPDAQGVITVDLDRDSCIVVRQQGKVTVRRGASALTLELSDIATRWMQHEWMAVDGRGRGGAETPSVALIHISTGAYLTVSLVDGAELARYPMSDRATLLDTIQPVVRPSQ